MCFLLCCGTFSFFFVLVINLTRLRNGINLLLNERRIAAIIVYSFTIKCSLKCGVTKITCHLK